MNVLFVHQNFPGQFKHLAPHLASLSAARGGKIIALGVEEQGIAFAKHVGNQSNLAYFRYRYIRNSSNSIHPWIQDIESKTIRAESCAAACMQLKQSGFKPDIIILHSGWGEGLCLNLIFPDTPILSYQEFFYNTHGSDFDFDPEFQSNHQWVDYGKLQLKQASQLLALEHATWNFTPTFFQRDSFPSAYRSRFSVIHDGINCQAIDQINPNSGTVHPAVDIFIKGKNPIVTCVMRSVEPYRGCHTLIRSIPEIQELTPKNSQLVIVGNNNGVSYGPQNPNGSWKDYFLSEIHGHYDPSRVHFVGKIGYNSLICLLKRSNAHIYLTYPFVLSWSLLEAMACHCAIVGSNTGPVREVIKDGSTGLLTNFFNPTELAQKVGRLLADQDLAITLGKKARELIEKKYDLNHCLPQQLSLIELVTNGTLSA